MNSISIDPNRNPQFPAFVSYVQFESADALLNGRVLVPVGEGPHPIVIMVHGWPGTEMNWDIAHALCRDGWTVLVYHPRGAWGSGGQYSFANALEDVSAAINFMRNSDDLRVDPVRTVLIGHSLGGWMALMALRQHPELMGVAALAFYNAGYYAEKVLSDEDIPNDLFIDTEHYSNVLEGYSVAGEVGAQVQNQEEWNLITHAKKLATQPLLLVGGAFDDVTPMDFHFHPFVEALKEQGAVRTEQHVIDSNHCFTDARIRLTRVILEWLHNL